MDKRRKRARKNSGSRTETEARSRRPGRHRPDLRDRHVRERRQSRAASSSAETLRVGSSARYPRDRGRAPSVWWERRRPVTSASCYHRRRSERRPGAANLADCRARASSSATSLSTTSGAYDNEAGFSPARPGSTAPTRQLGGQLDPKPGERVRRRPVPLCAASAPRAVCRDSPFVNTRTRHRWPQPRNHVEVALPLDDIRRNRARDWTELLLDSFDVDAPCLRRRGWEDRSRATSVSCPGRRLPGGAHS